MKFLLLFIACLFLMSKSHAQSISKQVIGSSGLPISKGTYTINFTVGEAIVGDINNGISVQQGFWAELSGDGTLSIETLINPINEIEVFPNPTVNLVQIQFRQKNANNYTVQLFDINGKEIYKFNKTSQLQTKTFSISHLAPGMYLLLVRDTQSDYNRTFKILKQ